MTLLTGHSAGPIGRNIRSVVALCMALLGSSAMAQSPGIIEGNMMFASVAAGDRANKAGVGLAWDLDWRHENALGLFTAYVETTLDEWSNRHASKPNARRHVTQFGITPMLRLWPTASQNFFVEAGIGATWIFPTFVDDERRFSTVFNFGDQVGIGWRLKPDGSDEVSLRVQHFSNASIKSPNPGANFVQLRYSRRF